MKNQMLSALVYWGFNRFSDLADARKSALGLQFVS